MVVSHVVGTIYPRTATDIPRCPLTPKDTLYMVRKSFILFYKINYHEVIPSLVYVTVEHAKPTIHIEPIKWIVWVHVTKIMDNFLKNCLEKMEEFQADILVFFITSWALCYGKSDFKGSDTRNVSVYSILQYVLQYGSAVLQYIAIRFVYCFAPNSN